MSKKRPNLSEEKRYFIKFMYKYLKWDAEEIYKHPSLNELGCKMQKRTVLYWMQRIDTSGSVERIKQKGAKRILNMDEEKQLIDYVIKNNKKSYLEVKIDNKMNCTARTLNNYALKNGISGQ